MSLNSVSFFSLLQGATALSQSLTQTVASMLYYVRIIFIFKNINCTEIVEKMIRLERAQRQVISVSSVFTHKNRFYLYHQLSQS